MLHHLVAGALFAALVALPGPAAPKASARHPNIVLVFIDDMGWADFSCFGNQEVRTENVDRLAGEGLRFGQFYVNAPICSPSRTAISTGQYPQRWRIGSYLAERAANQRRGIAQWLDPAAPMLARFLHEAGYATGHFGKWHMGGQRDVGEAPLITAYGFDASLTNFEGLGPRVLPLCNAYNGKPPHRHALGSDKLGRGPIAWEDRSKVTAAFVSGALKFIQEAEAQGKPFYVNVWPDDVHSPFFPPQARRGDSQKRTLYLGVLKTMDEQLGALFDYIRSKKELRENTLVLICSDNGPEQGAGSAAPLRGGKTMLYEGGVRSPLVVWGPGLIAKAKAGQRDDRSVLAAIDLVPSLLAVAGVAAPAGVKFDGQNMADTLLGKAAASRQGPLFFRRPPDRPGERGENLPDLAVRDGRWKLLCEYDGSGAQLYDLERDPSETANLAPREPDVVGRLTGLVLAWHRGLPPDAGPTFDRPKRAQPALYPNNRAPLIQKPYMELPLGAVRPRAWLREQLRRMAAGMTGHLDEWYAQTLGPRNGWLGGDGDAWERGPYWIDGLYPLAVLLDDPALKAKAMRWIEWTLNNQRDDGYLGPRPTAQRPPPEPGLQRDRQEDWWPKMVMLKILQQHYQATGDPRVIECLKRYFRYQLVQLPERPLGHWSWWAPQRGADNLLVVHWLYNLTGERWLLDLADLLAKQTFAYTDVFLEGQFIHRQREGLRPPYTPFDSFHCVNLAQGLKTPLVVFERDGDPRHLAATRRAFADLEISHGQPHGLFGGDEGMHGRDLDRGSELCTAVEMMYSLEKMLEISGQTEFADRLERVAFNALPTQVSDDFQTKQYYQQANQVEVTFGRRSFHNHQDGTALVYGVCTGYQCCTCNLHQGWPKLTAHLWMASADGGLAALVYAPCQVTARVGEGSTVTIVEETGYPFEETIRLSVETPRPVEFPLHLRIPGWCRRATVAVNGRSEAEPQGGRVFVLNRTWKPGDRVELTLPMTLSRSFWHERSVAIERGPLVYALRIEEQWSQVDPEDRQLGYRECRPGSPWNYALLASAINDLNRGFELVRARPVSDDPWSLEAAPTELRAQGVRLAGWKVDNGSAGRVPMSPHPPLVNPQLDQIRLIPYGCTTLRIAAFPWINDKGHQRPVENQ